MPHNCSKLVLSLMYVQGEKLKFHLSTTKTSCAGRLVSDSFGTSTVALNNKTKQAVDLAKSHLMCAVREEVEVLKEQIKELKTKQNKNHS